MAPGADIAAAPAFPRGVVRVLSLRGKGDGEPWALEVAELRGLYEELPYAAMRAAEALRSDGKHMIADDLLPFWRADNAVAEIIQRMNELSIVLARGRS